MPDGKNKSCEACRRLKIRCLPWTKTACQRCENRNEQCVVLSPKKRKPRRKPTDARVTELEKEVSAMRAMMGVGADSQDQSPQSVPLTNSPPKPMWSSSDASSTGVSTSPMELTTTSTASPTRQTDVIDRGILSMQVAGELYHEYNLNLAPRYPVVIFPPGYAAEQLRNEQPILFLAIIAASAISLQPTLSEILNEELRRAYADQLFVEGKKSLEMVQALLVTVGWYLPPARFSQLKFYEYIHLAFSMATDLGLFDGPQINPSMDTSRTLPQSNTAESSGAALELKRRHRSILACYINCCGSSLAMRRTNMLPFNDWIGECADSLLTLPDIEPSDRRFVAWVRLMAIAEAYTTTPRSENSGKLSQTAQKQALATYKASQARLDEWEISVTEQEWNAELRITYHCVRVLFCEPFLAPEHPCVGFRPPFPMAIHCPETQDWNVVPPPVGVLCDCVSSIHALFDTFLGDDVRSMPAHVIARVGYAAVVLTRLQVSAHDPKSDIGRAVDSRDLNLDYYATGLIAKLKQGSEPSHHVVSTFLGGQIRLRQWYLHYKEHGHVDGDEPFTLYASKANHPILNVYVDDGVSPRTGGQKNKPILYGRPQSTPLNESTPSGDVAQALNGDTTTLASGQLFGTGMTDTSQNKYSNEFIEQCSIMDLDALIANWDNWESDYDHFGLASDFQFVENL